MNLSNCYDTLKPENEFPNDLFSIVQRRNGAILIHFFTAIYVILIAEHICDEYFMPSLEYLSFEKWNLKPHVAGATILAFASSGSELMTSIIGVFIARNDLSLNTVLGSGSYNLLVITGVCCFYIYKLDIQLNQYPIYRDSLFYVINLIILFISFYVHNFKKIYWFENLISILVYVSFILINVFDDRINRLLFKQNTEAFDQTNSETIEMNQTNTENVIDEAKSDNTSMSSDSSGGYEKPYSFIQPYKNFKSAKLTKKLTLIVVFPARLLAFLFIIDFRRFTKYKTLVSFFTFIISLVLIGCCSYLLVWMVIVISETFGINESIIGLTFVAAATSMEETLTSISICKQELKRSKFNIQKSNRLNMAISNCIGSNVFDLSIGIGLPYLLNSLIRINDYTQMYTGVYSNLSFTVLGLILCLSLFLILLNIFKWRLKISFGILILFIWLIFTTLVVLIEMNIIPINSK